MRNPHLSATLGFLEQVLADTRLGPAQRTRLRRAKRELEVVGRTGKARRQRDRMFVAASEIAETLVELRRPDNQDDLETPVRTEESEQGKLGF